jgi:hypothetical protein
MRRRQQSIWSVVRLLAAAIVAAGAFSVAHPGNASAGFGTCAPATGAKCISSSGQVYEARACQGTQCTTCQFFDDHICTAFGTDVGDHYDSGEN